MKSHKNYWASFYQNIHISKCSNFANFCLNKIPKKSNIIEFGCGNGRDTYFFGKKGHKIIGIDFANYPKQKGNALFRKINIHDYLDSYSNFSAIVYSRFFLHSINDKTTDKLLKWSQGLFMAEFRAKGDVPILYPNHYRNKIDGNDFLIKMIKNNFQILYYSKSKNVAKFKNENPLIIRVIAKKIIC